MLINPLQLLILLSGIAGIAAIIWGIIDAASHPDSAWKAINQSKTVWVVFQALGLLFCWIGAAMSIFYFVKVRPQLRAQATPRNL